MVSFDYFVRAPICSTLLPGISEQPCDEAALTAWLVERKETTMIGIHKPLVELCCRFGFGAGSCCCHSLG